MKKIFGLFLLVTLSVLLSACGAFTGGNNPCPDEVLLHNVSDIEMVEGQEIDFKDTIEVIDACDSGKDYTLMVEYNDFNANYPGEYEVFYYVIETDDPNTVVFEQGITVTVLEDLSYPSGVSNLSNESVDTIYTFYGAAERYLLENVYGGIPLYRNASNIALSSRVIPYLDEYNSIFEYGFQYGEMTVDDEDVFFMNDYVGKNNEYTYRVAIEYINKNFNHFTSDTSIQEEYVSKTTGTLYTLEPDTKTNGYQYTPSLASDLPSNEEDSTLSTTWTIPVNDNLMWYFHEDTPTEFINQNNNTTIDATDFVNSWEYAMEKEFFRAVSGGADFISRGVLNAECFVDGDCTFDEVGLKANGNTIEITFDEEKSMNDVIFMLSSYTLGPIHVEYAEYLEAQNKVYGYSNESLAYSGSYYIDSFEDSTYLHLVKNPSYNVDTLYQYDGFMYYVLPDFLQIFEAYENGFLDEAQIPNDQMEDYINSNLRYPLYGTSSVTLYANRSEDTVSSTNFTQSMLMNEDNFIKALYYSIDREHIVENIQLGAIPQTTYFSDTYYANYNTTYPYRDSEYGNEVSKDYRIDEGYNLELAKEYYLKAIQSLISQELITPGTEASPKTIDVRILTIEESQTYIDIVNYLIPVLEETFQDDENHINVNFILQTEPYQQYYYEYIAFKQYDLVLTGLSECTLCGPFNQLEVYASGYNYRLFPGINVEDALIPVRYTDLNGNHHAEYWSYDAISRVLKDDTIIHEGRVADLPELKIDDVTPTTVTFGTTEHDMIFDNFTYTLLTYDFDNTEYVEVQGYTNIPFDPYGELVTITGLDPFVWQYNTTLGQFYQGDYSIKINYTLYDDDHIYESSFRWYEQDSVIENEDADVITPTSIEITLIINEEDYERNVAEINLYTYDSNIPVFTTTDILDNHLLISNLMEGHYILEVILDDGSIDYLHIRVQ